MDYSKTVPLQNNAYHLDASLSATSVKSKLPNGKKNKTDILYKEKLKSIDKSLAVSKQNVIKHIIQARNIEKSKNQVVLIKEALSNHIQAKLNNFNTLDAKYAQYLKAIQSGGKVKVTLTDYDLLSISQHSAPINNTSTTINTTNNTITGQIPISFVKQVYKTLTEYDDSALATVLDKYNSNSAKIDILLFTKIAQATSHNTISTSEIMKMYTTAVTISENIISIVEECDDVFDAEGEISTGMLSSRSNFSSSSSHGGAVSNHHYLSPVQSRRNSENSISNGLKAVAEAKPPVEQYAEYKGMSLHEIKWSLLKSLLRKRLLLIAVINSVNKINTIDNNNGNNSNNINSGGNIIVGGDSNSILLLGTKNGQIVPTTSQSGRNSPTKISLSHNNQSTNYSNGNMLKSNSLIMGNNSNHHNNSNNSNNNNNSNSNATNHTPHIAHDAMLKKLQKSQQKQHNIESLLTQNMTAIYTTDNIPDEILKGHMNALKYTRKLALQKVEKIIDKYLLFHVKLAFSKWKVVISHQHIEQQCIKSMQFISAYKLIQIASIHGIKVIFKSWNKWKEFVLYQQKLEQLAAIIEIQRYWRGGLVALRRKNVLKFKSAQIIQKYVRRKITITRINKRKRQIKQRRKLAFILKMVDRKWTFQRKKRVLIHVLNYYHKLHCVRTIQRYYRGYKGRQRFAHYKRIYIQYKSILLLQCAGRRYNAIKRVRKIKHAIKQLNSVLLLQRVLRGILARHKVAVRIKQNKAAIKIQYMFYRHKAWRIYITKHVAREKIRLALKQHNAAIKIQKIARGIISRRHTDVMFAVRAELRRNKIIAHNKIKPILLGYFIFKKYKPIIKQNTIIRNKNIIIIQRRLVAQMLKHKAKIHVKNKRIQMKQAIINRKAATTIQRIVRGKLGRSKAKAAYIAFLKKQELLARKPYYFRMKDDYYRTQNLFFRPFVIRIQCAIRCCLARVKVTRTIQNKAVTKIQTLCKRHIARKNALLIVQKKRLFHKSRLFAVVRLQKIARGFVVRNEVCKHMRIKMLLWFLREVRCKKMTQLAVTKYRRTQNHHVVQIQASVKIQAIVRGKQQKTVYKHTKKRLIRQRNQKLKDRKLKATIKIQSLFRMKIGRIKVEKQRKLAAEREKERRELEVLEASIEGLHEDFMLELMVIRAQNGVRGMLAKGEFAKKVAEHKAKQEIEFKNMKHRSATRIQALVRGVQGRVKFKKMLPALKKVIRARMYCVECEAKMATKRCRQCKDRYCNDCYEKLHMKGHRKSHNFEIIRADPKMANMLAGGGGTRGKGGGRFSTLGAIEEESTGSGAVAKVNPKDWEEFYDSNARAKYWFNKVTGEASWINPHLNK